MDGNGSSDHAVHAADLMLDIDRQNTLVGNQVEEDASECSCDPSGPSPCGVRATYVPNDGPSAAGHLDACHKNIAARDGSSEQGYAI